MSLKEGDILQHGIHFYRVRNVGSDVVINKIFYNPKTDKLQIYHGYEYVEWEQIGDGRYYNILDAENTDTKSKLEWIKRKYKIEKLNNMDI